MKIEFWFTCILRSVALFIFVSSASLAQQYPVQATAAITPPYSVFLSDYASADANPLQLHLFLRDLDRFEYRVKLRVRIEGPGITLTTRPSYVPNPIVLSGGINNSLSGFDIRSYFHPDNLNFSGISKQQFIATGKLPEGFYTFSFEVLDYARGVVVSNIANATAFCVLNDPPIINLPFNNEKVVATDPQNMMFSWTPRHLASPNSAFNTEYEFRLVELYPSSRNPNDAIRSSNVIFTVRTSMTSLSYGMGEPLLVPGRKYAFRVRAMDLSGRDLFKNNGYSEVYVFQFGDACVVPTQITGESLDANRIQIIWQESVVHTGYRVQYREKGTASWTTEPAYDNLMLIPELKPNIEYEYQVKGVCGTIHGSFSNSNFLKTMNETEAAASNDFQCGTPSPVHELNPTPLERPLKVDDVIWFGSTDIRITEIRSSAGGRMSGFGIRQVRMFNGAYAKVKLRNVLVNTNMRVIDGYHSTAWNLESQPVHYEDPDKKEESRHNTSTAPPAFNGPTIPVNGDIVSIALDSTGHIIATFADGTSQSIDRPEGVGSEKYGDVRLEDSTGEQWTVYRNDHISRQAPATPPTVATNASQIDFTVQFVKNAEAFAGLDVPSPSSYGTRYNEFTLNGVRQKTTWKAFEQGRIDYVNAMATGKSAFPSIVGFTKNDALIPSTPSTKPEQSTLTIEGTDSYEIKAYVPLATDTDTTHVEVGVLNAVMYSRIERMVHIVPVNGVQPPDPISVQAKLNEIYGQAVAGWTVVVEPDFEVETSYIVDLDKEESGALASYNQKCREFNKAYKKFATNVYRHDFYIFLISGSNSNRKGFMPFKRGFGYVFVDKPGDDIRAIAHELGHGAFNLQHPEVEFAKSDANNLMGSSGTGTELKKYQWDYVHDPQGMVGWLQGDDESALGATLVDARHTMLFDHIYENHKLSNQYYANKLKTTSEESIPLEYASSEIGSEWVKSWRVRNLRIDSIFTEELKGIITTAKGQKIPEIVLKQKHVYLGNYAFNGKIYPIAVYGNGSSVKMQNAFTKIVVSDIDDLENDDNKKHLYVNETFTAKYFIMGFYEEGRSEPSVIMQIEKFLFDNSLEKWLRYLKILVDPVPKNSYYGDIVDFPQIAPTSVAAYNDKNFKGGIYGCIRKVREQTSQTAQCGGQFEVIGNDTLYIKHHNGLDIYALPGTSLKAVINGSVSYETSNTLAGNKVKLSGKTENGKNILYVYCHVDKMQDGLDNGAIVTKGDIIAVAGATGNASNVPYKHCHLTIYVDGVECSTPSEYIKTKFDSNGIPDHGRSVNLVSSNN